MPGVKAIVTGKDEPDHYPGKSIRDIPVLCWDKVRYIGDKVAAVAAESGDAAEESDQSDRSRIRRAARGIRCPRSDAARCAGAARQRAGLRGRAGRYLAPTGTNVLNKLNLGKGNIEKGFGEAKWCWRYIWLPIHHQGYLSRNSFWSRSDDDRRVEGWASTEGPFGRRAQFAKAAGVSPSQIHIQAVHVGADLAARAAPASCRSVIFCPSRPSGR